jgi:hypothetical protein
VGRFAVNGNVSRSEKIIRKLLQRMIKHDNYLLLLPPISEPSILSEDKVTLNRMSDKIVAILGKLETTRSDQISAERQAYIQKLSRKLSFQNEETVQDLTSTILYTSESKKTINANISNAEPSQSSHFESSTTMLVKPLPQPSKHSVKSVVPVEPESLQNEDKIISMIRKKKASKVQISSNDYDLISGSVIDYLSSLVCITVLCQCQLRAYVCYRKKQATKKVFIINLWRMQFSKRCTYIHDFVVYLTRNVDFEQRRSFNSFFKA